MTRRAKTPKQQPIVDDADVQMLADLFLPTSHPAVSDEETVMLAEKAALACAYSWGETAAWRRELVRKVRRRVEFALMARRQTSRAT